MRSTALLSRGAAAHTIRPYISIPKEDIFQTSGGIWQKMDNTKVPGEATPSIKMWENAWTAGAHPGPPSAANTPIW